MSIKKTVTTEVDVDVEIDIDELLMEVTDSELLSELEARELGGEAEAKALVERVYEEQRGQPVSDAMRDLFWSVLGKIA